MKAKVLDNVYHILGEYNNTHFIRFTIQSMSANETYQLGDIYLIDKQTNQETIYYKQTTDLVQPWCRLGAINNIDGDKASSTDLIFTGGWHGYTNTNSGTPTSKTLEVTSSTVLTSIYQTVTNLTITVVNHVQGYNTIKEDGSGRAILKEEVSYLFNENTISVKVKATPLEDVKLLRYYFLGFQKAWDIKNEMLVFGDPFNYTTLTSYDTPVYGGLSDDANTNYIRFTGDNKMVSLFFNTNYTYNTTRPTWFYREYGKAYFQVLASFNNSVGETYTNLTTSDVLEFSGGYRFEDKTQAKKFTILNNGVIVKTDYSPIQLNLLSPGTTYDKLSVRYADEEQLTVIPPIRTKDRSEVKIYPDIFKKGSSTYVTGYYTGTNVAQISIVVDGVTKQIVSLSQTPKPTFKYYTGAISPNTLEVRLHSSNGALLKTESVALS